METPTQSPENEESNSDTRNEIASESARAQAPTFSEGSAGGARCRAPDEVVVTDAEVPPVVGLTDRQKRLAEIATRSAAVNARNHDLKMEYLVSAMSRDQIRPSR
jgi:hypothetical protein